MGFVLLIRVDCAEKILPIHLVRFVLDLILLCVMIRRILRERDFFLEKSFRWSQEVMQRTLKHECKTHHKTLQATNQSFGRKQPSLVLGKLPMAASFDAMLSA